jgi:MFS family permease
MALHIWRFITLLLAALTMGMTFAHVLEIAPKLRWDANLYLAVQTNLYWMFGRVGALIQLGAIGAACILAFLVRQRGPTFWYSLLGAIALVLSLVVWFFVVAPANAQTAQWQDTGVIPTDWMRWRNQWEIGHAVSFVLHLIGFGALLHSVIVETPRYNEALTSDSSTERPEQKMKQRVASSKM